MLFYSMLGAFSHLNFQLTVAHIVFSWWSITTVPVRLKMQYAHLLLSILCYMHFFVFIRLLCTDWLVFLLSVLLVVIYLLLYFLNYVSVTLFFKLIFFFLLMFFLLKLRSVCISLWLLDLYGHISFLFFVTIWILRSFMCVQIKKNLWKLLF